MHTQILPSSGLQDVRLFLAGERIVAGTPPFLVEIFLSFAATRPLVRWVDAVETFEKVNLNAAKGTQSGDGRRTPIWDHGITGKGQVIGAADTVSMHVYMSVCMYVCVCVCVVLLGMGRLLALQTR